MANSNAQPQGDFPTMGSVNANAVNESGAPSAHTTPVAKKNTAGGMIDSATASVRPQIMERNGASLRITTALYQANAAASHDQLRHTRMVPSALGNRDFWAARGAAQV